MSPHRTPGEVIPDRPSPLKKGPSANCPGCGASALVVSRQVGISGAPPSKVGDARLGYAKESPLPAPRACASYARLGWLWWKCSEPGKHLHERCKVCGLRWLTAFAEGA